MKRCVRQLVTMSDITVLYVTDSGVKRKTSMEDFIWAYAKVSGDVVAIGSEDWGIFKTIKEYFDFTNGLEYVDATYFYEFVIRFRGFLWLEHHLNELYNELKKKILDGGDSND